jgi:hypothetical protein
VRVSFGCSLVPAAVLRTSNRAAIHFKMAGEVVEQDNQALFANLDVYDWDKDVEFQVCLIYIFIWKLLHKLALCGPRHTRSLK